MGENVIRISVIRYSGIIVCAGGCVRPLIDMILIPVIANDHAIMRACERESEAIPTKLAPDVKNSS